ncbi:protein transport protein Sec24A [Leptopilina heterotoma]|uniref:protein transport protein Sec24A n=1 Tax=Leptopilina heterotoma TaxID=63436 RepID=UPI001CA8FB39|nr:protein transport protein Sec24A [Leptopilina heterotoma]
MSQLSNNSYPKNSESDSVLKSGPSPVNGIQNNVQYSQNGIQSPHLAGTPSSQSSRETSRDPSPTQYLRGAGHQSQYRPEWKPQMPPINGREIQNFPQQKPNEIHESSTTSSTTTTTTMTTTTTATTAKFPPQQNLSSTLSSSSSSSLSAGTIFKSPSTSSSPNTTNFTENKQKIEPPSSLFNDLRLNENPLNKSSNSVMDQVQSAIRNQSPQNPILTQLVQNSIVSSQGQNNPLAANLIRPQLVQNSIVSSPIANQGQNPIVSNQGQNPINANPIRSQLVQNSIVSSQGQNPLATNQVTQNPIVANQVQNPIVSSQGQNPFAANQGQIPIVQNQGQNPIVANQGQNLIRNQVTQNPIVASQGQNPIRNQVTQNPIVSNQGQNPFAANQGQIPIVANQGQNPIVPSQGQNPIATNQGQNQMNSQNWNQTPHTLNTINYHQNLPPQKSPNQTQNIPLTNLQQSTLPKIFNSPNLTNPNPNYKLMNNDNNQRSLSTNITANVPTATNQLNQQQQFQGKNLTGFNQYDQRNNEKTGTNFGGNQSGENRQQGGNYQQQQQQMISGRYPSGVGSQYGILPPGQNVQRMPGNLQNIPMGQNFYGGSGNVQQQQQQQQNLSSMPTGNFYPGQTNLSTSQINSNLPTNYSGANQLTNASLSGPMLTGQNAGVGGLQGTRMPFQGMPATQQPNLQDTRPQYPRPMSNVPLDNMAKRYPTAYPDQLNQHNSQISGYGVTQAGFNKLWGNETVDLLQCRNILPTDKVEPPKIKLHQEFLDQINCSPDIFRCTLTKIPESNSLLQKSRLPLGVLIHPFKDLYHLAVIQCSTIVRCRACRTYINPFVYFVDSKRWKCNLCYRVNELPDEFQFDPATKSYGDPSRRPEVKTSTIEFIAPSEYMLRPPQPAVYLFVLDVSRLAVESGYLSVVCKTIEEEISKMPGDGRMQIGFIAIDSAIHFFSLADGVSQPHEMIMLDVEDVFLPCPENLIVNLKERGALVDMLLKQLPSKFEGTHDTQCALGAALQAAYKLMAPTGGRVTVFQTCLPNIGPGALQPREDPSTRTNKDVPNLNPVTDFYKRLALDCSSQQIAIDLFLLNSQYSDLATLSGMCKFSGGCIYHIPLFRISKSSSAETLDRTLRRYLTRKIGFEAVMRIRCSRGLSIHSFHGNFFVRSTDLLSLPNVNPDAGFGMQVSIDETLSDVQNISFQAALLYTSSKGERRIRVHTLCLPVTNSLQDILHSADSQCIIGLLSKMAVDRSLQSSLSDARDALINAAVDMLSSYKVSQSSTIAGLLAPENLKLLPLYIIALLKCVAFRSGMNTRVDDRIFAMCQLKTLPLSQLIQTIYPDLYAVHSLNDKQHVKDIEGRICPQPERMHLSAEKLDSRGVFLLDTGDKILIYVGKNCSPTIYSNYFGVPDFTSLPEEMYELPEFSNPDSEKLCNFVFSLQEEKPYYVSLQIIREDSHFRTQFTERLVEDRFESALSYYEFLQHLKPQIK